MDIGTVISWLARSFFAILGLATLAQRRESRSLTYARRCLNNKELSRFFPRVSELPEQELRNRDPFVVNFARGAKYQNSAIIHCKKQLNQYFHDQTNQKKAEEKEKHARWRIWMAGLEERLMRRREEQAGQGGMEGAY